MLLGLKIFVFGLSLYGGVKLLGLGMEWLKILFENMKPGRYDRFRR